MKCYIEYLDCKNNYQKTVKYFDSYQDAVSWAKENFEKFNLDMIRYESN